VLSNLAEKDPAAVARLAAFQKALQELGWIAGRNIRIDYRWATDVSQLRAFASELAASAPDVILANAPPSVFAMQQASRTVPIVFTAVTDPVSMGLVQSLARPGGRITGFTSADFGMSAKWLELLKEVAPNIKRVAVLQEPSNAGDLPQFAAIQSVAPSFAVELISIGARDPTAMKRRIVAFANSANGGLIVTRISETIAHRALIVQLATQHRLPAVYPLRLFVSAGGLISYGPDIVDQFRHAAGYVDRILKGEKPSDLPVQAPTKYELTVNQKTANALGIALPPNILARADEVIE
jgi:putative ABC transport system substrate-binding protein